MRTVRARLATLWCWIRQLSGDDAFERYRAHQLACHPDAAPMEPGRVLRTRAAPQVERREPLLLGAAAPLSAPRPTEVPENARIMG